MGWFKQTSSQITQLKRGFKLVVHKVNGILTGQPWNVVAALCPPDESECRENSALQQQIDGVNLTTVEANTANSINFRHSFLTNLLFKLAPKVEDVAFRLPQINNSILTTKALFKKLRSACAFHHSEEQLL